MWRSWPIRDTIGEFTWFMRLLHRRVDSYLCCGSLHLSGEDVFCFGWDHFSKIPQRTDSG